MSDARHAVLGPELPGDEDGGILPRTPRQFVWAQATLLALVLAAAAAAELSALPNLLWQSAGFLETFKTRATSRWLRQIPEASETPAPLLSLEDGGLYAE